MGAIMKFKSCLMVICLLLITMAGVCSANVSILENPTIGVLPFKNKGIISPGWQREQMNQVTDIVYAELQDTKEFSNLVERERLRDLTDVYAVPAEGGMLSVEAVIASLDGARLYRDKACGPADEAEKIGSQLAEGLLAMGGLEIMHEIGLLLDR